MPTKQRGKRPGASFFCTERPASPLPASRGCTTLALPRAATAIRDLYIVLGKVLQKVSFDIGAGRLAGLFVGRARSRCLLQLGQPGECLLSIIAAHFSRRLQAGAKTRAFGATPEAAAIIGGQVGAGLARRLAGRVTGQRRRDRRRNAARAAVCPATIGRHRRRQVPACLSPAQQPAACRRANRCNRVAATEPRRPRASPGPSGCPNPSRNFR